MPISSLETIAYQWQISGSFGGSFTPKTITFFASVLSSFTFRFIAVSNQCGRNEKTRTRRASSSCLFSSVFMFWYCLFSSGINITWCFFASTRKTRHYGRVCYPISLFSLAVEAFGLGWFRASLHGLSKAILPIFTYQFFEMMYSGYGGLPV